MSNTIAIKTTEELSNLSLAALLNFHQELSAAINAIHNVFAGPNFVKASGKFPSKARGVARVLAIQAQYTALLPAPTDKPEVKLVKLVAGPVAAKEGTAHNMLLGIVGNGLMCDKAVAKFVEAYKATYKGVKTVDAGFAKGYIAGAIRRGHLVIAK